MKIIIMLVLSLSLFLFAKDNGTIYSELEESSIDEVQDEIILNKYEDIKIKLNELTKKMESNLNSSSLPEASRIDKREEIEQPTVKGKYVIKVNKKVVQEEAFVKKSNSSYYANKKNSKKLIQEVTEGKAVIVFNGLDSSQEKRITNKSSLPRVEKREYKPSQSMKNKQDTSTLPTLAEIAKQFKD